MPDACCSCEDVRKIINEVFDKRAEQLKGTVSKKRKLSQWQIFLKECLPKKADLPFKDRIKSCSADWKKK